MSARGKGIDMTRKLVLEGHIRKSDKLIQEYERTLQQEAMAKMDVLFGSGG